MRVLPLFFLLGFVVAQDCVDESGKSICGFGCSPCETCATGVYDCGYTSDEGNKKATFGKACSPFKDNYPRPDELDGLMGLAAVFGILMAFGIGANDAANSWATSVGAGAIALMPAVFIGGFFEWAGATALGHGVSKTIQKGVAKITEEECWACGYCNSEISVFMGGMFGALLGASLFLLLASRLSVPVSTTHAIVGGVVGVTVAGAGGSCLKWDLDGGLGGIILSWFVSPVLSGIIASSTYMLSLKYIIKTPRCVDRAKKFVPTLFGIATFSVLMLMFFKSKAIKKEVSPDPPYTWKWIISLLISITVTAVVWAFFLPKVEAGLPSNKEGESERILEAYREHFKKWAGGDKTFVGDRVKEYIGTDPGAPQAIESETDKAPMEIPKDSKAVQTIQLVAVPVSTESEKMDDKMMKKSESSESTGMDAETKDELDAVYCFKFLLVFNACLESFAHGSNDTANATGPFTAVYQVYRGGLYECGKTDTPIWILCVAGIFVAVGIVLFGHRVIRTIGTDLTLIDFHRAFWIEFGSTIAVICGTMLEMPVSTTHCQIGAVIAVGMCSVGYKQVDWMLLSKIFSAWVLTLPVSGGIASILVLATRGALVRT